MILFTKRVCASHTHYMQHAHVHCIYWLVEENIIIIIRILLFRIFILLLLLLLYYYYYCCHNKLIRWKTLDRLCQISPTVTIRGRLLWKAEGMKTFQTLKSLKEPGMGLIAACHAGITQKKWHDCCIVYLIKGITRSD